MSTLVLRSGDLCFCSQVFLETDLPKSLSAQLVSEDAALWPLTQHNPSALTGLKWGEGKEPPLWIRGGLGREVEKLRLEL